MPKPKRKKKTKVASSMTKSAFLYGNPNVKRRNYLKSLQQTYSDAINTYIDALNRNPDFLLQILMNDKKDSAIRAYEKSIRIEVLGAIYSQNAFDEAVTMLHNRLMDIKQEVYAVTHSMLASVKTLFYCVLTGKTRKDMVDMLSHIRDSYKKDEKVLQYQTLIDKLEAISDEDFEFQYNDVWVNTQMVSDAIRVPHVTNSPVKLNHNVAELVPANKAKCDYVLRISIPKGLRPEESGRERLEIPLHTSGNSVRRMEQYKVSDGKSYDIDSDGKIKVSVSFEKKMKLIDKAAVTDIIGVDTGISDALHTSDGKAIGSFSETIEFYKTVVEPLLGQISSMRNKKRELKIFLRKTKKFLTQEEIKEIRDHMDRIEYAIRHSQKAYRKLNCYHNMVAHEVKQAVDEYIKLLDGNKSILTAVELLDIKEFKKSKSENGMYSMFARGLLSSKLTETLNWHGYNFVQVDPAYTSQICPNCYNLDKESRKGKQFTRTCCGLKDDADHVGSINIKSRVTDKEVSTVVEKNQYNTAKRHEGIRNVFAVRHQAWREAHPDQILPKKDETMAEETAPSAV